MLAPKVRGGPAYPAPDNIVQQAGPLDALELSGIPNCIQGCWHQSLGNQSQQHPPARLSCGNAPGQGLGWMQAEPDVLATTGSDRSIALYDLRSGKPIRKLIMQTRTNRVAWNPMEAFNFTGVPHFPCSRPRARVAHRLAAYRGVRLPLAKQCTASAVSVQLLHARCQSCGHLGRLQTGVETRGF